MAVPIIPRVIRGRLYFQTADVLFPTFAQATTARQLKAGGGGES